MKQTSNIGKKKQTKHHKYYLQLDKKLKYKNIINSVFSEVIFFPCVKTWVDFLSSCCKEKTQILLHIPTRANLLRVL